jgi:crotonobetainyl-CoA:carnitine CoA-transferase CaiB-like acyl-CoA transferase
MNEDDAEEQDGALGVLTIIELSEGVTGPFAGRLLAEYGARVIKIERPGNGDSSRGADGSDSAAFLALNAGKLSLTLDYESAEGAAILRRLTEEADGIIEDAPTRRSAGYELDAQSLIAHVPRLVITQVAGLGDDDRVPEAASLAGLHVFVATLAGLWNAAQTEHGQVVEVDATSALAFQQALGGAGSNFEASSGSQRSMEHPTAGTLSYAPPLLDMSLTPAELGRPPLLGEHTDHVLHDLIGLDASEIEALRARGIV